MTYPQNDNKGAKNLVDFVISVREKMEEHETSSTPHRLATQTEPGLLDPADKVKIDNMGSVGALAPVSPDPTDVFNIALR